MKKFLAIVVIIAAAAVAVWYFIPDAEDPNADLSRVTGGEAVETQQVGAQTGDLVFALSAENTKINWKTTKVLAGKTVAVGGGWSAKFGSKLTGELLADQDGTVKQIKADIDFGSMWTESEILTKVLTGNGFFEVAQHPAATFLSTSIAAGAPEGSTLDGATHAVTGNFELNGVTKSITLPARLAVADGQAEFYSEFSLDRQEYKIVLTNPPVGVLLGDDAISDNIAIKVKVGATLDQPAADTGTEPTGDTAEPADTPTKTVDYDSLEPAYTDTIPATQVDFDMVLVPGNAEKNIQPFYLGKHEVTWDEFMPWVMQDDVEDEDEQAENRALLQRPSLPYQDVSRGFGLDGFPALSMSKLSATLYCAWLSEQTGKTYRLPTEEEWEHAYTQGGLSLDTPFTADQAEPVAVYIDNSLDEILYEETTLQVTSKEPNSLNIHNMAGNVCEWVESTGTNRVARGGHFMSELEELGTGRHLSNQATWNRDYPNVPKSIWWFVNAKWVGMRLLCEP